MEKSGTERTLASSCSAEDENALQAQQPFSAQDWSHVWTAGRRAFETFHQGHVDEQAGPAYFRGLWLSRQLFRRRLLKALDSVPPGDRCLDFGCGFGLALPYLSRKFQSVTALDLVTEPAERFIENFNADSNPAPLRDLHVHNCLEALPRQDNGFDTILALDVLEHIDALPELLTELRRLLTAGGRLIVSGPTENGWYQLGRKIVGFSGDYHVTDIYAIERELKEHFSVQRIAQIPKWPVLFEILHATLD